ncbi:MAG: hypothetical protein RMM17_13300 [Acidobacteriota bacterium]|nr:hypothetical protein [Blastocatellia bacterium]MDW8413644.1 hypothetical protein [Acidobacteriota bacterium]
MPSQLYLFFIILLLVSQTEASGQELYLSNQSTDLAAYSEVRKSDFIRSSPQNNSPPNFEITPPPPPTLRKGEKIRLSFAFYDPDRDAYFAAVIAVTPRIKLEPGREKPRQIARAASLRIDILPTIDNSIVNWELTAQNPGTAVFFVSIAELFTVRDGDQVRLISGKISHREFAIRVLDTNEPDTPVPKPQFLDPVTDLRLALKERVRIVFAADTLEHRPLSYGILYLAYASRLIRPFIGPNSIELKAVEAGRGLFVLYVTDGRETAIQSFFVEVFKPEDTPVLLPTLRLLSKDGVPTSSSTIQIYGEQLGSIAQILIRTEDGKQLQVTAEQKKALQFELPALPPGLLEISVAGAVGSRKLRVHAPLIAEAKRLRNTIGEVTGLRLIGYGFGRGATVSADGLVLKRRKAESTEFADKLVVDLPKELALRDKIEIVVTTKDGIRGLPWQLPLR